MFGKFSTLYMKGLTSHCNSSKNVILNILNECVKSFVAQSKFSINNFHSKYDHIRKKLDLVTFTEEIRIEKLHFNN